MFQAASEVGISPISLGFTGTLRVIRRAIPEFQQAAVGEKPLFLSWLVAEILDQIIPKRQSRVNPRVVKKGTELNDIYKQQMQEQFDFYYMTHTVDRVHPKVAKIPECDRLKLACENDNQINVRLLTLVVKPPRQKLKQVVDH
jgi:hypothetical protein